MFFLHDWEITRGISAEMASGQREPSDDGVSEQLLHGDLSLQQHVSLRVRTNWISFSCLLPRCDLLPWPVALVRPGLITLNVISREGATWDEASARKRDRKTPGACGRTGPGPATVSPASLFDLLLLITTFTTFQPTRLASSSGLIQSRTVSTIPALHAAVRNMPLLLLLSELHKYQRTRSLSRISTTACGQGSISSVQRRFPVRN